MAIADLTDRAKAYFEEPRVWQKLALIAATMVVPVALVAFIASVAYRRQEEVAQREAMGARYLQPLVRLTRDAVKLRGIVAGRSDEAAGRQQRDDLRDTVDQGVEQVGRSDAEVGAALGVSNRWQDLRRQWERLRETPTGSEAQEEVLALDRFLAGLVGLGTLASESSGVLFDQVLAGYYRLPAESELLARIRDRAVSSTRRGGASPEEKAELLTLLGRWEAESDSVRRGLQPLLAAAGGQGEALRQSSNDHYQAGNEFAGLVRESIGAGEGQPVPAAAALERAGSRALDSGFLLFEAAEPMVFGVLQGRVDYASNVLTFGFAGLTIGLLMTLLIVQRITRSITGQVNSIMAMFSELSIGNYEARSEVLNRDELGTMAISLNAMLDNTLALIQSQDERHSIQESISKLLEEVSGVAQGDLTGEAEVTADFTGAIADSFNYMIEQLRKIIGDVQRTTRRVDASAEEILGVAGKLVEGSETQASQIATTSEAIAEMATSIRGVSGDAEDSAGVARQALVTATKGNESVQDTIRGMNRIRDQVQETAKRIKRLGESSQEIGQIVELIDDIADRTSILALNASIQAAAAGEAGRGFAVVAEEVERLAVRSTDATKKIATLIKMIQSETNEAVGAMERSIQEVVEGSQLANQAGQSLGEIESVSNRLAELILSISRAAQQQAQKTDVVARTMAEISRITRETTQGSKKNVDAVQELAGLAADLRSSVSSFRLPGHLMEDSGLDGRAKGSTLNGQAQGVTERPSIREALRGAMAPA